MIDRPTLITKLFGYEWQASFAVYGFAALLIAIAWAGYPWAAAGIGSIVAGLFVGVMLLIITWL